MPSSAYSSPTWSAPSRSGRKGGVVGGCTQSPIGAAWRRTGPACESPPAVELVLVGTVTSCNFAVGFRAARRNLSMGNPEVPEMPRQVGLELRAVVRLNPLNGHGQPAPQFIHERDRRPDTPLANPIHARGRR